MSGRFQQLRLSLENDVFAPRFQIRIVDEENPHRDRLYLDPDQKAVLKELLWALVDTLPEYEDGLRMSVIRRT
jgi:hypothetical protein